MSTPAASPERSEPPATVEQFEPIPTAEPITVVAGAGALPFEAAAVLARRRPVLCVAIAGEADEAPVLPPAVELHRLGYGDLSRARRLLAARACRDVLFLGSVRVRPDLARLALDRDMLRLAPRLAKILLGGDDRVMRGLLALAEEEGFRILSVAEAVPELLAQAGPLGRHRPRPAHEADITLGTRFLDAAAPFDVGQAVVVVEGRIVAVEGAEGTDAMLARTAELRAARRVRGARGTGVLVKRAKRGQEMRADVPVVGAATLRGALEAQLAGIAVEAGRTIVAERAAMIAAADRAGAFLVALP